MRTFLFNQKRNKKQSKNIKKKLEEANKKIEEERKKTEEANKKIEKLEDILNKRDETFQFVDLNTVTKKADLSLFQNREDEIKKLGKILCKNYSKFEKDKKEMIIHLFFRYHRKCLVLEKHGLEVVFLKN